MLRLRASDRATRGTVPAPVAHAGAIASRCAAREIALVTQILTSAADMAGDVGTQTNVTILALVTERPPTTLPQPPGPRGAHRGRVCPPKCLLRKTSSSADDCGGGRRDGARRGACASLGDCIRGRPGGRWGGFRFWSRGASWTDRHLWAVGWATVAWTPGTSARSRIPFRPSKRACCTLTNIHSKQRTRARTEFQL